MGFTWACVCRSLSTFLSDNDGRVFLCQPGCWKRPPAAFSFRSDPQRGPGRLTNSAARTDVVLLIRRTVRLRGYASGLHSLRPCWTPFLSILRHVKQMGVMR
jgi:hypothetical protein